MLILICLFTGTRPCITSKNMMKVRDATVLDHGIVGLDCPRRDLLEYNTNDAIFAMADRLEALAAANQTTELHRLEQLYGVKYHVDSIVFDKSLRRRNFYRPLDHYVRDWMHVMCSNGVANTHIGLLLHVVYARTGIDVETNSTCIQQYVLPKKYGKVQTTWITEKRLHDDNLSSFAGTILSLCQIIFSFLREHFGACAECPISYSVSD